MTAERKEDVDGSSQLQLDELNDLSIPSFSALLPFEHESL
jgi:hypothetical protein